MSCMENEQLQYQMLDMDMVIPVLCKGEAVAEDVHTILH